MLKTIILMSLILLPLHSYANEASDNKTRVNWVKDLKAFLHSLEKNHPEILTTDSGAKFKAKFSLFAEAWAAGDYDCFYAGWPSKLVSSGSKKLCQSPMKGNDSYRAGACNGDFHCQPQLFGKDLCVPMKEKNMAFANCEKKFKSEKRNYDFLKTMTADEKGALQEISALAVDVCEEGKVGIQKSKPMCKNLLAKVKEAMAAIGRAPANLDAPEPEKDAAEETTTNTDLVKEGEPKQGGVKEGETTEKDVVVKDGEQPVAAETKDKNVTSPGEECELPEVVDKNVVTTSKQMISVVNDEIDKLYEKIKIEFETSNFCKPNLVLSNPKSRLNPVVFTDFADQVSFLNDPSISKDQKRLRFKDIADYYQLSEETLKYVDEELNSAQPTAEIYQRIRGVALQDLENKAAQNPNYLKDDLKDELAAEGIFGTDKDGNAVCPFVSLDAFRKAIAGRESVMTGEKKSLIKNPNLLTIVDYSMPSLQRRLFTIDLDKNLVIHNTWVGHGAGTNRGTGPKGEDLSQAPGANGDGSSPLMGGANSNLSREGFSVALKAETGDKYGPNVTFEGIDRANPMKTVVMHGWRTPFHEYLSKTWEGDEKTGRRNFEASIDIYSKYHSMDFKKASVDDMSDAVSRLKLASRLNPARPYIDATDGCLGVPEANAAQVDRKGRDKSQLELLREDLPGSLIFNYSGPGMKSNYFKN